MYLCTGVHKKMLIRETIRIWGLYTILTKDDNMWRRGWTKKNGAGDF